MTSPQTDIARAIRANDDEFQRLVHAQDAKALASFFYTEDAAVMPPDSPIIRGRGQIVDFWQGMFKAGLTDATLEIVQVEASGDLASEIGTYVLKVGPGTARGKYLVVHRRQPDDSWKAITDMFSGLGTAG
jgi:ketosteroid isomerase-like protein